MLSLASIPLVYSRLIQRYVLDLHDFFLTEILLCTLILIMTKAIFAVKFSKIRFAIHHSQETTFLLEKAIKERPVFSRQEKIFSLLVPSESVSKCFASKPSSAANLGSLSNLNWKAGQQSMISELALALRASIWNDNSASSLKNELADSEVLEREQKLDTSASLLEAGDHNDQEVNSNPEPDSTSIRPTKSIKPSSATTADVTNASQTSYLLKPEPEQLWATPDNKVQS